MPEIVRHVDHAELDLARRASECREDRPAFEDGLVFAEHQVIGYPERVVTELLGSRPPGQDHRWIELGEAWSAKELAAGAGEDRQTDAEPDVTHAEILPHRDAAAVSLDEVLNRFAPQRATHVQPELLRVAHPRPGALPGVVWGQRHPLAGAFAIVQS